MRICTIGVPRFVHDGLEVGAGWVDVNLDEMEPPAMRALTDYAGQFVHVHPDDEGQLTAHGLEMFTEGATGRRRIRKIEKPKAPVASADKTKK